MNKNSPQKRHWNVTDTTPGFKGDWIDLNIDRVELQDGKVLRYEALSYHRTGVGVVAENVKGEIILIKSYRYINDFTGWEVPAGTVPPDQHHADCIVQELREEAGCEVRKEDLVYTGEYYPSIGSSNQIFHCYYAKDVKQGYPHPDTNEVLETRWFTKEEIKTLIRNGEIKDGFALTILMLTLTGIDKMTGE